MFNRAGYNLTPFNRSTALEFQWIASADCVTGISAELQLLFTLLAEKASAIADVSGSFVFVFVGEGNGNVISNSRGTQVHFYELLTMIIQNLNMKSGDTVIIDSEHMVVSLNGVNVVDKITDESVFFDLKPGLNELSVSPINASASASIKVLWKDRWV